MISSLPRRKIKRIVSDDQKHQSALDQDENTGEQSISGATPDPESDDNVLDAAKEAGLYEKADEEHPQELNIAEEIEEAEKAHQEED